MALESKICAVILAAGRSRRMGQPKLLMPWGNFTVIGQVVTSLRGAGIANIVVVTGAEHEKIAAAIEAVPGSTSVHMAPNPDFERTEMLVSLQVGIRTLSADCIAALVVLGDQPTITAEAIRAVVDAYRSGTPELVIPSYHMRRGHPWLVSSSLWPALLAMPADRTPRDFLDAHKDLIRYVVIDAPEVLEDLDTPQDYQELHKLKGSSPPKPR